ncbi:MAG: DUF2157 domain-containing protein, partial [Proteobacteria bacterium]
MQVTRAQAKWLRSTIDQWTTEGYLDDETAAELDSSLEIAPFDWKRVAKVSFWVALICIVTSIGAILADDALLKLLEAFFQASAVLKCLSLSLCAGIFYYWGNQRRYAYPAKVFSNEAIVFLGVLLTAGAVYQFGNAIDTGSGHYSLLLLLSFIIYAVIGFFFQSNLIWIFALLSFGGWLGTETGYLSGGGAYYLGMNYPLRFVFFGSLLTGVSLLMPGKKGFDHLARSSLAIGLLNLFI